MQWSYYYPLAINCPIGTTTYFIRPGDTFWSLSIRFGTSVESIISSNPGIDSRNLLIGQMICIPVIRASVCSPGSTTYRIQPGDTFWLIAQRLGVAVNEIITLNPNVDPRFLVVGQEICIPAPPVPPAELIYPCTVPLFPTEPDARAGGSLWIREDEFSVTGYSTMFSATFLPEPGTIGDFDAYIGRITIAQPKPEPPIIHSVLLTRVDRPGHRVTWAGTRIIPEGPAIVDTAEIRLFNTITDITGPALLRNVLESCRR